MAIKGVQVVEKKKRDVYRCCNCGHIQAVHVCFNEKGERVVDGPERCQCGDIEFDLAIDDTFEGVVKQAIDHIDVTIEVGDEKNRG